jgi:hypothetical protein
VLGKTARPEELAKRTSHLSETLMMMMMVMTTLISVGKGHHPTATSSANAEADVAFEKGADQTC